MKNRNNTQIEKLIQDNEHLSRICSNQDVSFKNLDNDRLKLTMKVEELNNEIKGLHSKLNAKEDNLGFTRNQLEDANRTGIMLQVRLL